MTKIPLLLLAAGKSRRMRTSKQLLPWKGKTLLENAIITGSQKSDQELYVVVGAYEEAILPLLEKYNVKVIHNPNWETGIGTSIAKGIEALQALEESMAGVFIFLADQPFITPAIIQRYYSAFEVGKQQLICTAYTPQKKGVPALFDACYFDALSQLSEDFGAQQLMKKNSAHCIPIAIAPAHLVDIDTPERYQKYHPPK